MPKTEQKRYVRLEFTSQEHSLLRKVAAFADQNMAGYVKGVVERAMLEDGRRFGILPKSQEPGA